MCSNKLKQYGVAGEVIYRAERQAPTMPERLDNSQRLKPRFTSEIKYQSSTEVYEFDMIQDLSLLAIPLSIIIFNI